MRAVQEMQTVNTQSTQEVASFGDLLKELTFDFFGSGKHNITMNEFLLQENSILLDVRSTEEVQTLAMPFLHDVKFLHIPTNDIPDRVDEIPEDQPVAVFCSSGTRSAIVYAYLRIMGFNRVRILAGGYPDITEQAKPGKLWKRLKARGRTS